MEDLNTRPSENGFKVTREEAAAMAVEIEQLLGGRTEMFELETEEGRIIRCGRFRMRSLTGAPLYYLMFPDTKRGTVMNADGLEHWLDVFRKGPAPTEQ